MSIKRKGEYLLFSFRPHWPDDPWQVTAYDLTGGPNGVGRLLGLSLHGVTYYVQHIEGCWYYWEFN